MSLPIKLELRGTSLLNLGNLLSAGILGNRFGFAFPGDEVVLSFVSYSL